MKLGSLKSPDSRDGELILVSADGRRAVKATGIASSLREAVENWKECYPKMRVLSEKLNKDEVAGVFELSEQNLHSAMPRAFQWADASAFLQHVKLVRKSRNAPLPENLLTLPLMYQGGSDNFLAPREDIPQIDFGHGTDFEGEVAVILDDVPMGVTPEKALEHILLIVLVNDISLRGLVADELAQGFGFFQSKPSSALSPFALTPDELGEAWKEGRLHLPLQVEYNGSFFGRADAGEMHFHFGQLIAHAARTRDLGAGTIIGSGTVSNEDESRGSSCLAEKRVLEKIHDGTIKTPFMRVGDTVKIDMKDKNGNNLFGTIFQKVAKKEV